METYYHGFKNWTGLVGPTRDRSPFWSGMKNWTWKWSSRRSDQRLGGPTNKSDKPSIQFFFSSFLPTSTRPIPIVAGHWSIILEVARARNHPPLPSTSPRPRVGAKKPFPKMLQSPIAGHSVILPVAATPPPKSQNFKTERNLWWRCGQCGSSTSSFPYNIESGRIQWNARKNGVILPKEEMQRLYQGGRRTKLSQLSGLGLGFWLKTQCSLAFLTFLFFKI